MRFLATIGLILGFGCAPLTARADSARRRGGEGDWPLFCTLDGNSAYDGFLLRSDAQSPTGYTLYFYAGGEPQSAVYAENVQEVQGGEYLQIYATQPYGLFNAHSHHLLAYVAKSLDRPSQAAMKSALRGVNPAFHATDLRASTCAQTP
jgi:hypothetical protein